MGDSRKKKVVEDDLIITNLGANKDLKEEKHFKFSFDKKNINIRTFAISIFVILFILTAIFVFRFINFNATLLLWKTNLARKSENVNNKSISYQSFEKGLMRISNDGITFIDDSGDVNWTVSYNIKDPIYEVKNKYFVIADRNGNNFYIFNKDGLVGENTTTYPIVKISVSQDGILYVLQSDDNSSYINVFRENGNAIDIAIKTNLSDDGMPIDIATSKDGENLLVSFVCLNDDDVYTKATYYNFGDNNTNVNLKKISVEFIDELNDKFLARVNLFSDDKSCLIHDSGIFFVNDALNSKPKIANSVEYNAKINSIAYNEKYIALTFDDKRLLSYDSSGNVLCDRKIDFDYDRFYIDDDYLIFILGNIVKIYDIRGRMIFDKEVNQGIEYVAKRKGIFFTEFLLGLIDGVECIRAY